MCICVSRHARGVLARTLQRGHWIDLRTPVVPPQQRMTMSGVAAGPYEGGQDAPPLPT